MDVSTAERSLCGPLDDVQGDAGYDEHPPRMGFFTDTSVCIGCKACEVACKEWNAVPEDGYLLSGMSYDNTLALGAEHLAARRVRREAAGRRDHRPRHALPGPPAPAPGRTRPRRPATAACAG